MAEMLWQSVHEYLFKHNLIMQYFIANMPRYSSACDHDRDHHGAGSGPDRPVISVEK